MRRSDSRKVGLSTSGWLCSRVTRSLGSVTWRPLTTESLRLMLCPHYGIPAEAAK